MRTVTIIAILATAACSTPVADSHPDTTAVEDRSIALVAAAMNWNAFKITHADLRTRPNPKGAGTFVYVPEPQKKNGQKVNLLWLALDGSAYALNGTSKDVTPSLKWPREAPEAVWKTTGLNPYSATDAIQILF